jgi:hypothetical protein
MKTVLIGAAMLGFSTASATAAVDARKPAATLPEATATGEGGSGAGSVKLASAVTSTFLFVPDASQSPLIAVGEGGEGGRGRRWRKHYRPYGHYYGYHHYRPPPAYYRPYYARPRYDRPYYDHRYYGRPRFSFEVY